VDQAAAELADVAPEEAEEEEELFEEPEGDEEEGVELPLELPESEPAGVAGLTLAFASAFWLLAPE
jgi:hypothetical protein